jgi:N-acetylglucosamine malate deacetylase 1
MLDRVSAKDRRSLERVLVIAPHPDDEVFGCGGLIYCLKQCGAEVHVLYMTVGTTVDFSARGRSTAEERLAEIDRVASFLGFDSHAVALPGDDNHLRLDARPRRELVDVIERTGPLALAKLRPDVVIAPSWGDYNQDHQAVYEATIAACRPGAPDYRTVPRVVLTYELPYVAWSMVEHQPTPGLLVPLSPEALAAKLGALELYRSQLKSSSGPISLRGAETLARFRGLLSGSDAAEAFHVKRLVL